MRLGYYIKMLYHQISADSRHGTHSPHVYRLLDERVYRKTYKKESIAGLDEQPVSFYKKRLIMKVLPYLGVKDISLFPDPENKAFQAGMPALLLTGKQPDVSWEVLKKHMSQGRVLVWSELYMNNQLLQTYRKVTADTPSLIALDFFHLTFTYCREEQGEELFRLKFPYFYNT